MKSAQNSIWSWQVILLSGLLALCLLVLSGCSATRPLTPQALPEAHLYTQIPEPTLTPSPTNGDLARWVLALRKTIADMNTDRASLKAWVDTLKESE